MGCGSSKPNIKDPQVRDVFRPGKAFPKDSKFKLPTPVFEYFKALMLKNSAPPKKDKAIRTKAEITTGGRLADKQTAGRELGSKQLESHTDVVSNDLETGRDLDQRATKPDIPQAILSVPNLIQVPEVHADTEAVIEVPKAVSKLPVVEEIKEPVVAFEDFHSENSDARFSPEPPKIDDNEGYDDESMSFDDAKIREGRLAKEKAAQEEAARRAEEQKKAEEAELLERRGKLEGMNSAAQNILSKYA